MKLYFSCRRKQVKIFNIWLPINDETGMIIASSLDGNIGHVGQMPFIQTNHLPDWKGMWIEV